MNFNTIHHSFEHATSFLLSVHGLPNKLTVGHIGQPWALGSRKQDKLALKKSSSFMDWIGLESRKQEKFAERKSSSFTDESHISIHVERCFLNWQPCCKVFYNYFHLHPDCSIFSREIPKLCFFLICTLALENNLYHWNYRQFKKFWGVFIANPECGFLSVLHIFILMYLCTEANRVPIFSSCSASACEENFQPKTLFATWPLATYHPEIHYNVNTHRCSP